MLHGLLARSLQQDYYNARARVRPRSDDAFFAVVIIAYSIDFQQCSARKQGCVLFLATSQPCQVH